MTKIDLKKYDVDYLLVTSTNKYLLEYVPEDENICNQLTGFTGDIADALFYTDDKCYLFVDSRFHIQADLEVDKSKVEVVKLQLGQKKDEEICNKIKPNSTLGINPEKVSQKRYEKLKEILDAKNVEIKFILEDSKCRSGEFVETDHPKTTLVDNILITNSEELSYILGIRCFSFDYSSKVDGKLLIINKEPVLFTDYEGKNKKSLSEFESFIKNIDTPIQVDKTTINAKDYSLIKHPVDKASPVKNMKSVKTKEEIEHLKYCFEMTDKALKETRDWIYATDNISERSIKEKLKDNFKKHGAKYMSFASIVAANENSALAHYNKTDDKILKDGDLILIDCGAYYEKGYATDITRVFVKGEPSEVQKQIYTNVLKVFLNCCNYKITDSTSGYKIDKLARDIFDTNKIDEFEFSHGLGHGVGIGVHESPPNLSKNEIAKTILKNGMVFTIEPGLYKANVFGIRLENTFYLNNGKISSLSNMCFEKKLINFDLLNNKELEFLEKFEVC